MNGGRYSPKPPSKRMTENEISKVIVGAAIYDNELKGFIK